MLAQHGVVGGGELVQRELADRAVLRGVQVGGDRVDARLFEPLRAPRLEVAARRAFELGEQVVERRVRVRVAVQVVVDAFEELAAPHVGHELLQDGRALGVGDAVEVHVGVVEVVDRRHDRVRGAQLVLVERPALLARAECGPRVLPFGRFGGGERGGELGERLVEPQVVPPLHRHIVAEPHVRELVQHGHHAAFGERVGHLRREHVRVADRDHADVLHGAGVVFRHVDLVVLRVRVWHAPRLRVEREALLGDVEQVVHVFCEVVFERLAAVLRHRDRAAVLVLVRGVPFGVRAGADRGEVRAHRGRGREGPALGVLGGLGAERAVERHLVGVFGAFDRHVRRDDPRARREHGEAEHGLEVGLVEDGVDAARVRHFELRVQVHVAVGGVHAAVQAFAGRRIAAHGGDDDLVALTQVVEGDAVVGEHFARLHGFAVERDRGHFVGDEVEERALPRLGAELDRGCGDEGRVALR